MTQSGHSSASRQIKISLIADNKSIDLHAATMLRRYRLSTPARLLPLGLRNNNAAAALPA
jgi:hypothetical protein